VSTDGRTEDARRRELLGIAARTFAANGYRGTSLQQIADEFGVLKSSLYHYIRGKDDLLFEVIASMFHRGIENLRHIAAAEPDPVERLRAVVRGHLLFIAENLAETTVFLQEIDQLPPQRRADFPGEVFTDLFASLVADGQRIGAFKPDVSRSGGPRPHSSLSARPSLPRMSTRVIAPVIASKPVANTIRVDLVLPLRRTDPLLGDLHQRGPADVDQVDIVLVQGLVVAAVEAGPLAAVGKAPRGEHLGELGIPHLLADLRADELGRRLVGRPCRSTCRCRSRAPQSGSPRPRRPGTWRCTRHQTRRAPTPSPRAPVRRTRTRAGLAVLAVGGLASATFSAVSGRFPSGIEKFGVRWNTTVSAACSASSGIAWMPDEPVPITASRLPVRSTSSCGQCPV
jgi:AcrR family transcriptional regulator